MEFLEKSFYNNSIQLWILAILVMVATFVVMRVVKRIIIRQLKKLAGRTKTNIDDLVVDLLGRVKFYFLLTLAIYFGTLILSLPRGLENIVTKLVVVIFLIQVAIWGNALISYWLNQYKKTRLEKDAAAVTTFTALGFIFRMILWSVVVLLALDNMGIDITALIAGLGVGGIAIALAVQNILSDLFASLSIVLDKPFVIGDFIIIDNYMGTVEHIGLKTTRVRSLYGEQLVFANSDLLQSRIRNYKRMYERRVVFTIGVTYQTPVEKLKKIPGMIQEIIEAQEQVRFDRAHFKSYGDFSLNFEIVYWVLNPDYKYYMDVQQNINLELFKRFEEEGIEFAYPTQTIFVTSENGGNSQRPEAGS